MTGNKEALSWLKKVSLLKMVIMMDTLEVYRVLQDELCMTLMLELMIVDYEDLVPEFELL